MKDFIDNWLGALFRFSQANRVPRELTLYASLWVTVDSYRWAKHFVEFSQAMPAMDMAARIGPVLAAVTALQGWVLKLYVDSHEP